MASTPVPLPQGRPNRRFQNLRTITALILREMSSTYGRSPGGYVWAVLEPVAIVLILAVAFSFLLRSPSLGTSFVLFYATGLMPFRMYQEIHQVTASAIRYSKALLVYPAVSFLDALLARFILAVLTQLTVTYLIFAGILVTLDLRVALEFGPILLAFSAAALLGFGIGSVNCLLFELFPIWKSLWTAASRPLLLLSAIIYIYEDLPRFAQNILWYNPLVHLTGLTRTGFYSYYEPDYISMAFVFAIALISLFFGLMLLRRHYRKILMI
ncbi:MAG: ABC transporter permease [Rhodobacter sp.]|nr:ABC transporter permease [Rhodobacter sp.]